MKKIIAFVLICLFVTPCAFARTKYDKYGHKITKQKKTTVKKYAAAVKIETDSQEQNKNNVKQSTQYKVTNLQKRENKEQTANVANVQNNVKKEEKVKTKEIGDKRGRNLGTAVRQGDSDNFTMYDKRGRRTGTYTEDKNGNGKFYDLRGREIRVNRGTKNNAE